MADQDLPGRMEFLVFLENKASLDLLDLLDNQV